jgi:ribosomal protein S18 acetylase RimI-like enzyme
MEIRRATGTDALGVARVHIATWRAAYRGIVPQEFLDSLDVRRRARNYTFDAAGPHDPVTWIALDEGDVVGFVTVGLPRDDEPRVGEVQALYVASERWRGGLGATLLKAAESLLTQAGATTAYLWVLEDNERGRRFYDAQGWRHADDQQTVEIGGTPLVELRYHKVLASDW